MRGLRSISRPLTGCEISGIKPFSYSCLSGRHRISAPLRAAEKHQRASGTAAKSHSCLLPDVGGSAVSPRAADIKSHEPVRCIITAAIRYLRHARRSWESQPQRRNEHLMPLHRVLAWRGVPHRIQTGVAAGEDETKAAAPGLRIRKTLETMSFLLIRHDSSRAVFTLFRAIIGAELDQNRSS